MPEASPPWSPTTPVHHIAPAPSLAPPSIVCADASSMGLSSSECAQLSWCVSIANCSFTPTQPLICPGGHCDCNGWFAPLTSTYCCEQPGEDHYCSRYPGPDCQRCTRHVRHLPPTSTPALRTSPSIISAPLVPPLVKPLQGSSFGGTIARLLLILLAVATVTVVARLPRRLLLQFSRHRGTQLATERSSTAANAMEGFGDTELNEVMSDAYDLNDAALTAQRRTREEGRAAGSCG